ncbi:MAG: hypothetical protein LBH93_08110, partial [Chitinispirillales bacterium]|nr:hypothetical protein [Chitinispirillales bacterium]
IDRKGRTVQVDGILLEWNAGDARPWPGSPWTWDAVITAHGLAGYFSCPKSGSVINARINPNAPAQPQDAPACSSWTFTFSADNTEKSFEIKIPESSSGEFFAFDKGTFESGGALTAEWLVPWSFFEDDDGYDGDVDIYALKLSAACGVCGALAPMALAAVSPKAPRPPAARMAQITMVVTTAVLTVALIVHRRRKIREFGRK